MINKKNERVPRKIKSLDNRKSLKIIVTVDNYQPSAVEAAKLELSKREVSEADVNK